MSSRPGSVNNPLSKAPPLATIRREVVTNDPLADPLSPALNSNRSGSNSPTPDPRQEESYNNYNYASPPPSYAPALARPASVVVADPTEILAEQILSNCVVKPTIVQDIPVTREGVVTLAKVFAWPYVVKFTTSLLQQHTLDPTQSKLEDYDVQYLLMIRFEALFRLKMYDELNNEINVTLLNHLQDTPIQDIDYTNSCFIDFIFSIRLLQSEVLLLSGQGENAIRELDLIQRLLEQKKDQNLRIQYWIWQCEMHRINSNIRSRNWKNGLTILRKLNIEINQLIEEDRRLHPEAESSGKQELNDRLDLIAARIMILCRTSRLLLQIGANKAAIVHYEESSRLLSSNPYLSSDAYLQSFVLLTQGLIEFSQDKYDSATEIFGTFLDTEWTKLYEENSIVPSNSIENFTKAKLIRLILFQSKDENLFSSAINNFAVCSLYLKKNLDAITRLEKLIGLNPLKYMIDPVVFNLCTMYDLSFSPDVSLTKKKALQKISAKFGINDPILHWRSFRLN